MSTCDKTGRVIYIEEKVAHRTALRGWVRGGKPLALRVRTCPFGEGRKHFHLVPHGEDLVRENLDVMEEGALARVVNATNDLSDARITGIRRYPPGFEFVVEDYVSAEVAKDGRAFYWGSVGEGGNNVCVLAADVEQARTAEEMGMRQLPEAREILDFVVSGLLREEDGLKVDATDLDDGKIVGYGETAEGLEFGFVIPVTEVRIWRERR